MPGQGLASWLGLLWLLAGADPPQTIIKPSTPPAAGTRHYLVQVRIVEVDEQGRTAIIASPTVQTTGAAAGVTIDSERGRRFEFHFSATEPGAPSPLPVLLADETTTPKPIAVTSSTTVANDRVRTQRISLKAVQQPRGSILREVVRQAGLRLVLEPDAAAVAGPYLSAPVSCDFENAPLEQALQQLIGPTKLGYSLETGLVIVGEDVLPAPSAPLPSTPAVESWVVKVYDVSDLVVKDAATGRPDFQPLLTRLRAGVLPKSWETGGGEASVRGFDSTVSLVIRHTSAGHDAIAQYLNELRTRKP